ncbi:MAG: HAMP domain-containing histidine kinase [Lachnospiraceae bacterium]|nr:HAMP domain-containing histidine kinase [Lachnospiraceae bacterium]
MRPLNDLARKAEEISRIPLDTNSKIENLEHAISSVSPDGENVRVRTGDKELESIEIALNNLLYRMKESQKQQARFVSDASHELRTPISVVQGYVNMLDRWGKEDPEILEESIEALKHESEHMKELIEQLLFLARGDSGRNTLNKISIDLNEIMKEVWEESEMIDSKHTYEFEECPGALMTGDVAMVKQSVRIFVQNASKYSNEGDNIKLGVRISQDSVSYLVQDEGIGMQEEDVSHIFERFYRSDKARNGETGGSGLGLSIAKWIIDAHDGTIEVLSRPDIGTRFTVTFPRKMNIVMEEE